MIIPSHSRWTLGLREQETLVRAVTTLCLGAGAVIILLPLVYMLGTALKSKAQVRQSLLNPVPMTHVHVQVKGKREPLYQVDLDGRTVEMALVKNAPGGKGLFVDPADPEQVFELPRKTQIPVRVLDIQFGNFQEALTIVPFDRYLANTLIVTFVGMAGMLFSSSLVAYGFSRFRAPGLNLLFLVLLSTIMLPRQVRLIPLYVIFQKIGWIDTLLPLIVPLFFANAFDVFLLRQFFMTISLEQDEAAQIDGANSLQRLIYVILPQSKAAVVTVAIFHFLYAWNDFYEPLIFLHSRHNWTMAVGLQQFHGLYAVNTHLIMAASAVMVLPPILLFFVSQRIFMQGVVISGSKG
ncbi:MAG: carbohydrate ABC transporter permease [Chloroflexi bacterium]|nr:carbohydrate ABC transporter permease [Chloroflexota bacterium]